MINDIETEYATSETKANKLTFFPIEEIDINEFNNNHIEYYFKSSYKPVIIRNGANHFPAIKRWKTDFNYLISKCGDNEVYCRTETDNPLYRNGQKYKID